LWVCWVNIEHVTVLDIDSKLISVATVFDFEHSAANILPMLVEKAFDEVAVNRCAPIIAP